MRLVRGFSRFAVVAAALALPAMSQAAAISIDDTRADETVVITVNDFEFGFFANGQLIQQGLNNAGSLVVDEIKPLEFHGEWLDLGQSAPQNFTVYWVEPNTPLVISDVLRIRVSSNGQVGTIDGFFQSDFDDNLGLLPVPTDGQVIVERPDGGHDPFLFSAAFLSGEVRTGPGEAGIPLPSAAMMGLAGLGALIGVRRFRRA